MKFLKKLFKSKESGFGKIAKSTNLNKIVVCQEVFSHGWNDPSEILEKNGVFLELTNGSDGIKDKWNYFFYKNMPLFYSLSFEEIDGIKDLIKVDPEQYREIYDLWPKHLTKEEYQKIYSKLKLDFVKEINIEPQYKGKHLLMYNYKFWDYVSPTGSNLIIDMVNSYERQFEIADLTFDSIDTAVDSGILLIDDLCHSRGPNNVGWFENILEEEIAKLNPKTAERLNEKLRKDLEVGYFSVADIKVGERKEYYQKSISEFSDEIKRIREIIVEIEKVPFSVYQLNFE